MADDNSQAAAPIDLSAGLVPKTGALGKPAAAPGSASAPTIDLSAGLVEKPAPPEPAEPSTLVGKIDHAISWLTRPADPGETDWTAKKGAPPTYKGPVEYALRKGVGSVAEMIRHPLDTANAAGTQIGEAPLAAIDAHVRGILTPQVEEALHKRGYSTAAVDKALKLTDQAYADIHDQLHAMGHEAIHDPYAFIGEQGAQALFFHYLGVGAGKTGSALGDAARGVATRAGKAILDVGPADTTDTIRTIAQENADKLKAAAKADADAAQAHLDKVRTADNKATKAEIDHAQATVDARRYNQRMLNRHQAEVDRITEANAALEHTESLRAQREAALAQHTEDFWNHLDVAKADAKAAERKAWAPIDEKTANVTIDGGEIEAPLKRILDKSPEAQRVLNQMTPDPADVSPNSEYAKVRVQMMKHMNLGDDYWKLTPDQRVFIDRRMAETGETPEPIDFSPKAGQPIPFDRVQRFKSLLGQQIGSGRYEGVLLGEMRQVFKVLDQTVTKAAADAGAGDDLAVAKEATRQYQKAFGRDRHLPATVDETLRKGSNPEAVKERDEQENLDAAKVHDPSLADSYNKVKTARAELKAMPTAEQLRKQVKQVPRPPSVGDLRGARYQLKEPPKPYTVPISPPDARMPPDRPPETDPGLTPSTVDEIKQRNVKSIQDKLRNYRKISTFRLAEMGAGTLGIVSGIASIATGALGATQGITGSLGKLSGGAFALALTPKLLSHLMNTPEIIAKLASPGIADYAQFMKMPAEEQGPFKAAMIHLAKTAEKEGKLRKPSPWISFFSKVATGAAAANKPAREQQQQIDKTRSEQLDKDTMSEADKALNESKVKVPIAIHDKTGRKLVHTGHGWVDMQTGEPVNG